MDALNRITIKSRMVLFSVLVLFLFIVFAIFSINEMNALGKLTSTLYEHPLKVSNAALKAKAGVIHMHRSMKDLAMSKTEMDIHLAILEVQSEEKIVYQNLDIVKRQILGKEGKQLVNETIELFSQWKPIRMKVERLTMAGDKETARDITRTTGAEHVLRLERKMVDLSSYAINKADGFMEAAREVQERVLRKTIIYICATILLSLLIAYFITRSILSSVSSLKDTMGEVNKTGILVKSELGGKNEIADMASYFNRLVERLQGQFWLKGGEASLSEVMAGDLNYDELVTNGTHFICRYVDACAGALYAYDEKRSLCTLKASYAFVEGKHFSSQFGSGEGIVGQVALEKKPVLLKGITPEDALGKTGTVSEPPRNIYAVPLLYERHLYGVLEVAAFEEIPPLKIEFLGIAAPIIATSLYTALQGMQINTLLATTQKANEELAAQAEELQSQSKELQQTSEELQKQNTELIFQQQQVEEANRLKSEFLSNMSHELRTPLNSVMALSRVLISQAEDKLSEEELNYLKVIARNGRNLLTLINDILDLAKIESGRMDVIAKPFSINSAIEVIIERLEIIAEEKGIEIKTDVPDNLPQISSDEARVDQILQNLLGNAIKFTEKGHVAVSVQVDDGNVHIEISDTGIGISEKDLPHIFEEFRQVDGTTARQYEGTGLGLAIAHKSARMLGGELTVRSVPGKGSAFTLTLPLVWQEVIPGVEAFAPKASVKTLSPQETILVVDDEPEVAAMIAQYLSQVGYFPITATSGAQALALAEKHRPFAITLDVIMPDMDGFEVLQNLKENPGTRDIPTIIVSMKDDKEVGFALGAVGYITKPVNKDVLISEINKIAGRSPHTIMVVDDNAFERGEIAQIIHQAGMRAFVAENGVQCMEIIANTLPDVLVLDLMMPDMDGFEVLERVRKDPVTKHLPVIVVTAKALTAEDRKKLTGNATAVLAKSDTTSTALLEEIRQIFDGMGKSHESPESRAPVNAKKILVVEDNQTAMLQIRTFLESEGYRVDTAGGGQEAIDYVKHTIPDGIILDLMMPNVDGFAVLNRIRAQRTTENIPVLILTAKDLTRDDLKELKSNNVQQLVQKGDVHREILLNKTRLMLGEPSEIEPVQKTRPPEIPKRTSLKKATAKGKQTILVVEDRPDSMITMKAVLHNQYEIMEAKDGKEGLKTALTGRPDLILLDMSLPEMDGFMVVARIKEDPKTRHIPVIALTARAMKGDREAIIEAGCDDYISKPVDPEAVLKKIAEWLEI